MIKTYEFIHKVSALEELASKDKTLADILEVYENEGSSERFEDIQSWIVDVYEHHADVLAMKMSKIGIVREIK